MCNLYDVGPRPAKLLHRWEQGIADLLGDITYVAPGRTGIVVTGGGDEMRAQAMTWGFRRTFRTAGKAVERRVNNSRDDKLDGRMWGKAFRERRCLIPTLRFYEWSGPKGSKSKHAIGKGGEEAWFYIAGIWEESQGAPCYSMITTGAGEAMKGLHDRMPLVLADDSLQDYMDGVESAAALVAPYDGVLNIAPPPARPSPS